MSTTPVQILPVPYYLNLLTSEYSSSAIFKQWLQTLLNILDDISNCLIEINGAFDLDVAIGVQLDVLGQIVGVFRTVPFQPSASVSPILDDTTYRLLIKATIANNQWDGKIGSLYPIWSQLFAGGQIIIQDNQNMSANIILTGTFTSIIQDLITHDMIVPRPEGVQYNYFIVGLPFFGFDRDDAFVAGWDTGKWS